MRSVASLCCVLCAKYNASTLPLPYNPTQTEHLHANQLAQMLYHEACTVQICNVGTSDNAQIIVN
jgi:hypothetical protein